MSTHSRSPAGMAARPLSLLLTYSILASTLFANMASAHDHGHNEIPEGQTITMEPIDTTLWVHIFIQMFTFGIMFPVGMVLGMIKSRWHVPVQVLATVLSVLGYFLGHMHGGREFVSSNVHAKFATWLMLDLLAQVVMGIYLKLHLERGLNGRLRPWVKLAHGVNGKAFPLLSWVQLLFGGITGLGFCQGDHLGQCLAHFIMGSAFIAYGVLLTILLLVGQLWLRRTGRSQEFFDSAVIAAWGCVNTFTEHRWGTAWVRNDWQHTTMGIIWWCAGLAGIWLSRDRAGHPKRNFVPGFVLLMTGWAMSAHPQELAISAMTHAMFGKTLMAAGLTRIIEVAFILMDKGGITASGYDTHSFQYIPVFLLYASGFLFMGATEEQMALMAGSGLDHVSYILILYSLAFLLFLFVNMLIHLYDRTANADGIRAQHEQAHAQQPPRLGLNGHVVGEDRSGVRDAEEFELAGLMSDDDGDEDEESAGRRKLSREGGDSSREGSFNDEAGLLSPSTVGRNYERVAP